MVRAGANKLTRLGRTASAWLLALAWCTPASAAAPTPSRLVVVQQREPISLNPLIENGNIAIELGLLLFQFFVKYDDRGQLVGDAAREVPSLANGGISKDGRTVTYRLRPGLRFSDGEPVTAADCVFSIEAVQNARTNVQGRTGYDEIAKAEARDATTLVLHLERPYAPLLVTVLAPQGYPILPAHLLRRYPDLNRIPFNTAPIGSGPYVAERWIHGDRLVMRANPSYFAGPPAIERLELHFVPDANTIVNLLRTGEADGAYTLPPAVVPPVRALPRIRTIAAPGGVGAVLLNTTDPLAADPSLRHALAEAIDAETAVAKAYGRIVSPRDASAGLFLWAYDPKASPPIPYDPGGARKRLDAAGWVPGPDGIRAKDGRRAEALLVHVSGNPADAVLANLIASYERAVGIDVTIKSFVAAQLFAPASAGGPIFGGDYTFAIMGYFDGDDPDVGDQFSCAAVPPHGYNKTRICDPELDALFAAGVATFDVARRKAVYARVQRRLAELLPQIVLYRRVMTGALRESVAGASASVDTMWWNVGAWRFAR